MFTLIVVLIHDSDTFFDNHLTADSFIASKMALSTPGNSQFAGSHEKVDKVDKDGISKSGGRMDMSNVDGKLQFAWKEFHEHHRKWIDAYYCAKEISTDASPSLDTNPYRKVELALFALDRKWTVVNDLLDRKKLQMEQPGTDITVAVDDGGSPTYSEFSDLPDISDIPH